MQINYNADNLQLSTIVNVTIIVNVMCSTKWFLMSIVITCDDIFTINVVKRQ